MFNARAYRILIIEDDRADREIYKLSLRLFVGRRFEFLEAESAEAGVEAVRESVPDCILLDYNLPDMDGLEALACLKGSSEQLPCPVVMLTAYGGEALAVQAMKAGVMDYLPKQQANADLLPHTILGAIEKFELWRRVEEQRCDLEASAQRYQVLLEAMPQMVWTANDDGCLEYANSRWVEYTGMRANESLQEGWNRLVHPEDRERTCAAWAKATATGSAFEIEHRLRRASDDSYRWHLVRARPMRSGGSGRRTQWFGTCTEIEEQKQTEESRLERQKLESIGRLAGGIAHDFNNLLVAILGGASLAMDSLPVTHPSRSLLEDVIRAGDQAAQLTRQMLAYAGRGNFFVEPIRMGLLVRETCERIQASLSKKIRFEIETEDEEPLILADLAQMRQVITDLVENAVEAIGEDGGTISVRTGVFDMDEESLRRYGFGSREISAGKHVGLEVGDTGCGMDEETRKQIFDPFYSTKSTGRGLGLAGVQGFVRSSKGGIHVVSSPGKGSQFRVFLPAAAELATAQTIGTRRVR